MADEAEYVLELETEAEVTETDTEDLDQGEEGEPAGEDGQASDDEELVVGFSDDEETAPVSEGESSVLRDARRREREKDRRIRELEAMIPKPQVVEAGPEPTLESCEYDEDRFKAEWRGWNERKAKADQEEQQARAEAEAREKAWAETVQAYEAEKASLGAADYDEAESEVQSMLSPQVQSLLLKSGKGAALVYALGRNPAKLEALSKLDLTEAAMMIGELRGKLTVERKARTSKPAPDRGITGTATMNGGGNLDRLRDRARKTGNWDAYFAAKRAAG